MVEKIIFNTDDVRAYGNIFSKKNRNEYVSQGGTNIVSLGNQTVNNATEEVFTIKRTDTVLTASSVTAYVGYAAATATLKTDENTAISGKELTLTVANASVTATTNSSGVASFNLLTVPAGVYTAYVKFDGDNDYGACDAQFQITINKFDTSLSLSTNKENAVPTEEVTLTATLTSLGNDVDGATIDFYDGAELIASEETDDGVASITHAFTTEGTKSITAVFVETDTYKGKTSNNVSVVVAKKNTTLTINNATRYYDTNRYTIGLKDSDSNAISGASLSCKFTNRTTGVVNTVTGTTNSSGVLSLILDEQMLADNYNLTVTYDGTAIYKGVSKAINYTIKRRDVILTVALDNATVAPTETSVATVTLKRASNNHALSDYNVKLYAGNTLISTLTTDSNGQATYDLTFDSEGTRVIKAVFDGDNTYNDRESSTVNLVVVKHTSQIIADNDLTKGHFETLQYTARLKDVTADSYLANQTVTFEIRGEGNTRYSYTTTTDSNGYALWNIGTNIPGGEHPLFIYYNGSTTIASTVKQTTITVDTITTAFDVDDPMETYWMRGNITGTLTYLNSSSEYVPLSNKTVKITFNGYSYNKTTDSNGAFSLDLPNTTQIGTYNAVLKFAGDNDYKSVTETVQVIVTRKRIVTFNIDKNVYVNPKSSGNVNVPIQLLYNNNAISGKTITYSSTKGSGTVTTDSQGKANIPLALNSEGSWELLVSVAEDTLYEQNWKYITVHAANIVAQTNLTRVGSTYFLSWTFTQNDNPILGETVTIKYPDNSTVTKTTDNNGEVYIQSAANTMFATGEYTATYNNYSYTWDNPAYRLWGDIVMVLNNWAIISWTLRTNLGGKVANAQVVITYPNNSTVTLVTDDDGEVWIEDANTRGEYTACYSSTYCDTVKY